jgi:hypothetical protein
MISQWSADGTADDSLGANNGLLQGDVKFVTGKLGQAFSFDGNSFVEVANSPTLEPSTITVAAWVKSLGSPGAYRYVLAKGLQNCDASSYGLYTGENGGLSFYIYDGITYVSSPVEGQELWDGSWHYVAGTYDGANVRLYVDGVEVGTGTPAAIPINYALPTDQKFYIGAQSPGACGFTTKFVGDIDEARVWNRARSASEIQDDFATDNNAIPVAADQFVATDKNISVAIALAASDADGDPLTYSIEAGTSNGILSGTAPNLTYTPDANYTGPDSLTFKAHNGRADSNLATVSITVNSVNKTPVANAQYVTTDEDTARAITLTATDTDGDTLTYGVVMGPAHGTLSGTAPNLIYRSATNYNGSDSFSFKANDTQVDSLPATVTIMINPVNDAPEATNDSYGAAQDTPLTVAAPGVLFNDTDVEGGPLKALKVNGPGHGTLTLMATGSFTYTPAAGYSGPDSFTYKANDNIADSNIATVNLSVVTRTATTSTLTLSKSPQQYSDLETFKVSVSPVVNGQLPAQSVTFKVGTQVINTVPLVIVGGAAEGTLTAPLLEPTPWGTLPTGQMKASPLGRTVTALFNDVNPMYTVASASRMMMISKEDARATYTGQTFAPTSCTTCATATVTLSATIKDISATDEANGDSNPGDIRHATVTFVNRETGASISPLLSVTLPNANDPQTGTVSYNWPVNIGTADAQTFRVGILVDPNYYVRYNSSDDALVTVAKPITNGFIAGGGSLVMSNSSGLKAGEVGSSNDFSFSVKYNGQGSNPTGSFNTIVRTRVSGLLRVYQVKGSVITSLVLNGNKATLKGTAAIYDITNGSSLAGTATFEVSITDNGEPGSSDTIATTIRDSANALWFSSNWNGLRTTEQLLARGNIRVY